MATAKKKASTAAAPSAAVASSSASPTSTAGDGGSGGGGGRGGGEPSKKKAAPSDKTSTTTKKKENFSSSKSKSTSASASPPSEQETMTRCTEKDVLLGRGKRVSEWPGNVHFRQVVNRYREEYATAERANKVKIAAAVIAAVQNIGGRFVRETTGSGGGRSSWYVVTHDRAVEKTCQALREKEKANPPNVSPFVGDYDDYGDDDDDSPLRRKRSRLSPNGSPGDGGSGPRTKRKILHRPAAAVPKLRQGEDDDADSDEETSSDDDDDDDDDSSSSNSSDSDDGIVSSTTSEEATEEDKTKITKPSPAAAKAAATAAKQIKGSSVAITSTAAASPFVSREEIAITMMDRLRAFWSTHGHAAVPPIWPRDQALADWCIQQRQLHREIIVIAEANDNSSKNFPANRKEESQQQGSSTDVGNKEEINTSDQRTVEPVTSEQNGTANQEVDKNSEVNKGDDSGVAVAKEKAASIITAPTASDSTTAATTANTPNDHVKSKQQAEPYRRGSPAEICRIEALNRLGFCWDYAAWHWEHQCQLLVAQVAPPVTAAAGGATIQDETQEVSGSTQEDDMDVDGEPAKKDDTEQMDVDKESTMMISNGTANKTEAKTENDHAVEIDTKKEGQSIAPTTNANQQGGGVKDGFLYTRLIDETLEWIDDQQDQYHNQGHQLVSKERRNKLEAMGIYF